MVEASPHSVFQLPFVGSIFFPEILTSCVDDSLALSETSGDGLKIRAPSGM